ncbi:MAG: alpha-hydroxy-acid oxidizing protein, partial [Phaeodactylibacter sp.]|nr:alpha-hydroxy-acid oxidizing protein [Phaeodactylibacter sp.]
MEPSSPAPQMAMERQRQFYVGGMSGQKPIIPTDFMQLEALAKERMRPEAFAYVAGGAGEERTMHRNATAFDRWQIHPRMLKDVSERDLSIELFGRKLPTPLLLSPIGVLELAHKTADLGVAKAAAGLGIPMIFSNQASVAMESCAAVMGNAPRWFQLYWSKSNDLVASLVRRAEAINCEAIVVTLDTTLLGWRQRDLDLAYLPFLRGMGIAQYVSDPVFQRLLQEEDEEAPSTKSKITFTTLINLFKLMRNYPG